MLSVDVDCAASLTHKVNGLLKLFEVLHYIYMEKFSGWMSPNITGSILVTLPT